MSKSVVIQFVALPHFEGLALPSYETAHAAGMDLRAAVPENEPLTLAPGARVLAPTGITMALPDGYEAQIRPRSGLAAKHGVTCLNTPGLIDPQYRGEVKVLLVNTDPVEDFAVTRGDRIAQLVVQRVELVEWVQVEELDTTTRDVFGFGSTGR